ncbi:hypothetical protein MPER_07296 [Moniliophthora perniciosa FA553]|nr:hypothetical protein MPER_07296 [Moniliophthora perniciosa FA553]
MKNLFGHKLWKPKSKSSPSPVVSIIEDPSQTLTFLPVEEDIRRLFTECKIGIGNAGLLRDALSTMTPDHFRATLDGEENGQRQPVIKEFREKCLRSRELIASQIAWAAAGAERSRRDEKEDPNVESVESDTEEEKLLAELLEANEELNRSLEQYDDLERVVMGRNVEGEDTSARLQGHDTVGTGQTVTDPVS